VVIGVAEACKAAGCALLGGETAEMPGVYVEGAFDLAGTVVGLVSRATLLPKLEAMQPGDVLVGLPSSGPHTNGYSLIRRVVEGRDIGATLADGVTLGEALLQPHRCYRAEVDRLQVAGVPLHGMAHITGGGFVDNVPRILPEHLAARVETSSWELPPLFAQLVAWSGISYAEAYRVWNMGIGMILVIPEASVDGALAALPEAVAIGHLAARATGGEGVELV
jgi:phosphoribosylformylglycinamidine cyclo-ligase